MAENEIILRDNAPHPLSPKPEANTLLRLPPILLPQMLEETSQEEIDDLADQLQEAQDRVKDLEGQVAALQRQPGGRQVKDRVSHFNYPHIMVHS